MYFVMKYIFALIFTNLLLYGLNIRMCDNKKQYYTTYIACVLISDFMIKAIEILV